MPQSRACRTADIRWQQDAWNLNRASLLPSGRTAFILRAMKRLARLLALGAACAALTSAGAHAQAPPALLAPLDVNKAQGWGDALAACDLTLFLLSDPDVTASTIIAPGAGSPRFLYPPLYTPPNLFYAPSILEAFHTLEARKEVDRKSVVDARYRLAVAIVPRFHKGDTVEKTFLADQMKLCNVLTDGVAKAKK